MYTDLSSFISTTEISRSGHVAEIVVDYTPNGPIRLLGFATQSAKADFDIWEEGWRWYNELINTIHKQTPTGE